MLIYICLGHHLGHAWENICGILSTMDNNGQHSAVLHTSVMPFLKGQSLLSSWIPSLIEKFPTHVISQKIHNTCRWQRWALRRRREGWRRPSEGSCSLRSLSEVSSSPQRTIKPNIYIVPQCSLSLSSFSALTHPLFIFRPDCFLRQIRFSKTEFKWLMGFNEKLHRIEADNIYFDKSHSKVPQEIGNQSKHKTNESY